MPTYTLGQLAEAIDARLEGDPEVTIRGIARLEDAGPDDLSFLANARYLEVARRSDAGAVVVGEDYRTDGQNVLRSGNPYLAFARAVELISPHAPRRPGIHSTAVVDPSARVSDSAMVGPLAVIGADVQLGERVIVGTATIVEDGVTIGDDTRLFPRVTVHEGTRIGVHCVVQSGAVLGSDGFGYAPDEHGRLHHVPQRGGLAIADHVEIGANVTVDRGSAGDTVIGEGTKIDNLVHVAHNVVIGRNTVIVAQVGIAGSARIGSHVQLGGQSGIQGHIQVGDGSRIGGQAGVIGDVPAGVEVSGYPARSHREQMRAYALFARLPEMLQRIKALEERLRTP